MRSLSQVREDLVDVKCDVAAHITTAVLAPTKKQKVAVAGGVAGASALGMMGYAFADTTNIFDMFITTLNSWIPKIIGLGSVIAALAFALALIMMIFSSDPSGAARAKSWLVRIVIGWVALIALVTIVNLVGSATKNNKWNHSDASSIVDNESATQSTQQ